MKVKLKTTMCGPTGSYQAGQIIDVESSVGRDLVAQKFAEIIDEGKPKVHLKVEPAKIEEAAMSVSETAVSRGRGRPKKG